MKKMRREDRAISQEDAMILLIQGEYGVLSTVSDKNEPYGVPMNYFVRGNSIYFHSANEGEKIEHVENNIATSDTGPLPKSLHAILKGHRWDRTPTEWSQ